MEQNSKLKSIESQPILACSYIFIITLINAIKILLHRAYALSSTTEPFNEEYAKLRSIFSRLDYPWSLIDSVISNFISSFHSRNPSVSVAERNTDDILTI